MNDKGDRSSRTVTIERIFDAPVKLVWEAWTNPDHITRWWSPKGIETKIIAHNFKVGGKWKYIMPMPNGKEFTAEGTYIEIVPFERICSTADFRPMTEGVEIQAHFSEKGDKTSLTFLVIHSSKAYRIQQEKMGILNGWGSVFDRLKALLTKISTDEKINDL